MKFLFLEMNKKEKPEAAENDSSCCQKGSSFWLCQLFGRFIKFSANVFFLNGKLGIEKFLNLKVNVWKLYELYNKSIKLYKRKNARSESVRPPYPKNILITHERKESI